MGGGLEVSGALGSNTNSPQPVAFAVGTGASGLANPLFTVSTNGALAAFGTYTGSFNSGIPAEGSGTRMMWYPGKAAFRTGYVNGTQWDDANIGNYSVAMGENVRASGSNGIALGVRATAANVSSVAIGEDVTASGAASVALGYHAHTNARPGSFVFGDRSSADSVRASHAHQATFRTACGFRIFTSSNLSTGVAFGGSSVSNLGTTCPTDYFGQSGTMIATSTGAYLSSGGTWTNASDRNRKHRIAPVSGEDVLARLRDLPVTTWSYRVDDDRVRHMGPMAQDFYAAFKLGSDSISIGTVDAAGVALAAAKALEERTSTLASRDSLLMARLDALAEENARLRRTVAALQVEQRAQRATLTAQGRSRSQSAARPASRRSATVRPAASRPADVATDAAPQR
jgi:hypothetical protein